MRHHCHWFLIGLLAAGCAADGASKTSASGTGGSMSTSTSTNTSTTGYDAGISISRDASAGDTMVVKLDASLGQTLGADALVFNWDGAKPSATGGAVSSMGGAVGSTGGTSARSGGTPGTGGSSATGGSSRTGGSASSGGSASTGGSSNPGGATTSSGGATTGGGTTATGGNRVDGSVSMDAAPSWDSGVQPADSPVIIRDAGTDTSVPRLDTAPPRDTASMCVAKLVPLVPTALTQLVSAPGRQVVLRAEATVGGIPIQAAWSWEAVLDGGLLATSALGTQDPAQASFPIAQPGTYSFKAYDIYKGCTASISAVVLGPNVCADCDRSAIVQAAPPFSTGFPVQRGSIHFVGSAPYTQPRIVLGRGTPVKVAPSVGSNIVVSYVRILDVQGNIQADGVADQMSPFGTRLLAINASSEILRYHVLVVPLDGQDGGTIGATAPQLFTNLNPTAINGTTFQLSGGQEVVGTLRTSSGTAVLDARMVFTNQAPGTDQSSPSLIFSSVGRTNAQGIYRASAQPTSPYWATATPPSGAGLIEALSIEPIPAAGATVDFTWQPLTLASTTLTIRDALGAPLANARVRLTTASPKVVGSFQVVPPSGMATSYDGVGNILVEGTTSTAGQVVFGNLPIDTQYSVAIVPQPLSALATTTTATFTLASAAGASITLAAKAQTTLTGQLSTSLADADLSQVVVWAYDKSKQDQEAPRVAKVQRSGDFSLAVSPDRTYVLMAVPPVESGMARTFVGPGAMVATEFKVLQKMTSRMLWSANVVDDTAAAVGGAALQVFCQATWPSCVDDSLPLAETTSLSDGTFGLSLPDPATR